MHEGTSEGLMMYFVIDLSDKVEIQAVSMYTRPCFDDTIHGLSLQGVTDENDTTDLSPPSTPTATTEVTTIETTVSINKNTN